MPSDDFVDSASFRDPSGHVYRIDGRIYRTVTDHALDDFEAVRENGIYGELAAAGKVVAAEVVNGEVPEVLGRNARVVLEHPPATARILWPSSWRKRTTRRSRDPSLLCHVVFHAS